MGRHKSDQERVLGPYPKDPRAAGPFRLIFRDPVTDLRKVIGGFATFAAALKERGKMLGEIKAGQDSTVEQILGVYEDQHLRLVKANRPLSLTSTVYRLRLFFGPVLQIPIGTLDSRTCQDLRTGRWKTVPGKPKPVVVIDGIATRILRTGKPATPTSQLNILNAVRTFTEWCLLKGYLRKDPMDWFNPKMEPEREKGRMGNSPLSLTQAEKVMRVTFETALETKGQGDIGIRATAVALTFATGLRATTIISLNVGSVERRAGMGRLDNEGAPDPDPWLLWYMRAKKRSQAAKTAMQLEEVMEVVLGPLLDGRKQDEPLFTTTRHRRGSSVGTSRLTEQQVAIIRAQATPNQFQQGRTSIADLARRFGVSWTAVSRIVKGETWNDEDVERKRPMRDWLRDSVAKMCELAEVPTATAHQIRGMIATQYAADGNIQLAQKKLAHGRVSTTKDSYASRQAVSLGEQRNILKSLKGGRQ